MDIAKKIDTNLPISCLLVLLAQVAAVAYSLPLAWPCYFLASFILWKANLNLLPKLALLFMLVPVSFLLADNNVGSLKFLLTFSMFLTVLLESISISILKKTNSWPLLVEVITIIMLVCLCLIEIIFPNLTATFIDYIAKVNEISADAVNFPPGIFIAGITLEALLFVWLGSRLSLKIRPMSEAMLSSASEIRVGISLLIASFVLPVILYVLNLSLISVMYILAFPFVLSGLSLLSWIYKEYKKQQKKNNSSFIWLIFIFLYATLLPLALGILGLIDIGLNLREKYQNYLKRR